VITLQSTALRLSILPSLGGGITNFEAVHPDMGDVPLWRPASTNPTSFNSLASYSLVPWSNRIDRGVLGFAGKTHQLRTDWPDGTAIHGDAKHRPWHVLDRSPISVHLTTGSITQSDRNFPWPYEATIRYELRGNTLLTRLGVINRSAEPFPAGLGFHPFWFRQLAGARGNLGEQARVTLDVKGRYPCERIMACAPAKEDDVTRQLRSGSTLESLDLDDVFSGFSGKASIQWPGSGLVARYECSPEFSHAVLYSPSTGPVAPYFCLEPVTMVNNGFALRESGWVDTGVAVVEPGRAFEGVWSVTIDGAGR
jgi:aldose 1-epimerase